MIWGFIVMDDICMLENHDNIMVCKIELGFGVQNFN
jgi:hypothetical protein